MRIKADAMLLPFRLLNHVIVSLLLRALLVNSQICSEGIYGRVNARDCFKAINAMPFAQYPVTNTGSSLPRLFSEPQFQIPKFEFVKNDFRPRAIVQLPKVWKHGKSSLLIIQACHYCVCSRWELLQFIAELISPLFSGLRRLPKLTCGHRILSHRFDEPR